MTECVIQELQSLIECVIQEFLSLIQCVSKDLPSMIEYVITKFDKICDLGFAEHD